MYDKNHIPIENLNLGGLAYSKYQGPKNSVYKMIGLDIHSEPGIIKVEQKLTKDSGTTVTEFCKWSVNSSNGNTYWFSSESGKIWERNSSGTWSLVYTVSPTNGEAKILGAIEFQGYIYFFTQNWVHRILAINASGSANWTANAVPNWAEFSNGDLNWHPAYELNLVLYIGDGNLIAQIGDTGVFTADALDINDPLRVKALNKIGNDLVVGTYVNDNINKTQIYRWNTYSTSWSVSDTINEVGVNAFLDFDNYVLCQCGTKGNIYFYNGEKLQLFKKIPGVYSNTKKSTVHPNAIGNVENQCLFGMSNVSGNPSDLGVYRIGRHSIDFNFIMDLPYPISQRDEGEFVLSDLEIGSILVSGSDIFVSWKNGASVGIDKLDWTTKLNGAFFETMVAMNVRNRFMTISELMVAYSSLPTNTDIDIYYSINYNDYVLTTQINDISKKMVYSEELGLEANTIQMKVKLTSNVNNAPEIESGAIRLL